jgi:hypothetical protein
MESEDRLTGALVDRYRIEREIGSGGISLTAWERRPAFDFPEASP